MTTEEKAKAYDEAIKRAEAIIKVAQNQKEVYGCITTIFPELCESDDEKIRKHLISLVKNWDKDGIASKYTSDANDIKQILAWLEKQGEQKLPIEKLPSEMKTIGESLGFTTKEECNKYNQMVSDIIMSDDDKGEQKPTDKVEPKFKVKYAGSEYNVFETKNIAGVTYYGIEDEPDHIDYVLPDNCEIVRDHSYGVKEKGNPYPTKSAIFSEQKSAEWGEKDEYHWMMCLECVEECATREREDFSKTIDWLKSLKERYSWKPSDEQMEALKTSYLYWKGITKEVPYTKGLESLYEQLKKLREE